MTNTPSLGAADAAPEDVDARLLQPWLTALLRWLIHGFGIWLVAHGVAQGRADSLEPIITGLALSIGALAWSLAQKKLAQLRIVRAARADPRSVVVRR